jgi:hypothetical protein
MCYLFCLSAEAHAHKGSNTIVSISCRCSETASRERSYNSPKHNSPNPFPLGLAMVGADQRCCCLAALCSVPEVQYQTSIAGHGSRAFASGGIGNRGPQSGPHTTYWNLRSESNILGGMESEMGAGLAFVGVANGTQYVMQPGFGTWVIEPIPPNILAPQNIHEAQHALRLKNPSRVSPVLGGQGLGGKSLTAY